MRRQRIIGLVVALTIMLVVNSGAAQPQGGTVELRGEVVSLVDRAPVADIDLRLVGIGPLRLTQSGTFIVEVPRGTRDVQLTLVNEPERAVLYPVGGRLPVPNDEQTIVTVVIGRSTQALLADELSKQFAQIEQVVAGHGQQYRASLSDVDSLLRRMVGLQEDEFRASVSFHKEKLQIVPPLMKAADRYMLEVKDMRDDLRLLAAQAATDLAALLALRATMEEYNRAFTALNDMQHAAVSGVRSLWAGQRGEGEAIVQRLEEFFRAVVHVHETYILSLNPHFVNLQLAHSADRPSEEAVREAVQQLHRASAMLDEEITALAARKEQLFNELDQGA